MIENFLTKLGASTKIAVGVSISPSVGLEMIEIDRLTGTVNKYSNRPLEYNHSTREIANYEQFKESLEELFEELHIPKRSNIILNVPNVHFGMINLPLLLTDEAITNAIISEVEQSYIFKRQEPLISWAEVYSNINTENRTLAYTAIQKNVLDEINIICSEVGCSLIGVESSYISLLRALHYSELAKEEMKEGTHWNLMIIAQNSYAILSMVDKKIIEYYEEPLALKSFVDDEIYNAITTSAKLTLAGLPASNLLIISETDLVSAEVLSMKLDIECSVNFLECNKYIQNELLPVNLNVLPNMALKITLESIGAAIYPFHDFPLKLNMVGDQEGAFASESDDSMCPKINLGNLEIALTPDFVKKTSLLLGGIIIIPIAALVLLLNNFLIPREQAKLAGLDAKITQAAADIAKYNNAGKDNTFDLKSTIDKILSQNKTKLTYYDTLGISIPNKLWVSYYMSNEAGKIDIKGKSTNVESIYTFYKNIKQLVNDSDIRLYKLEIASSSIDDVVASTSSTPKDYDFEITNMTETELNPPPPPAAANGAAQPAAAQPGQATDDKKPLFQLGKPLFGPKDNTSPNPSGQAAPAAQASAGQLPKNLEKIEKF
ncbi:MAG: hypothetical protein WCY19_03050 [Candidatus Gastranaerophilaceae bacterium]